MLGNELKRPESLDITICGPSETKMSGSGLFRTLDGHAVLFSCKTSWSGYLGEQKHILMPSIIKPDKQPSNIGLGYLCVKAKRVGLIIRAGRSVLLRDVRRSSTKITLLWNMMRQPWDNIEISLMIGLADGKRGRGRPRISWINNIFMWTGLTGTELMSAVGLRDRRSWGKRWSVHVANRREATTAL